MYVPFASQNSFIHRILFLAKKKHFMTSTSQVKSKRMTSIIVETADNVDVDDEKNMHVKSIVFFFQIQIQTHVF